ncbi:ribonuclease III [Marinivivus vitaminiproducens]|uniref:ribonuclease III n=1 Tax=Marinivivus vitaminiproducens TaxID=3035935 RepID=UPI0027A31A57|nr:ribonuclease III [Geminicoccaceae bacterium SCSIO 64248]
MALERLSACVGYRFRDPGLLSEALTHASAARRATAAGKRSNERLEFLGDRVLGLVVADMLIHRFAEEPEGSLSRRHTALVRRETLAEIAGELGLGDWLSVARSEEDTGGRSNPAILADACEALIAAIYLDGGMEPADRFIRRLWQPRLTLMIDPPRDPKTALQEWAQGRGLELPAYTVRGVTGPPHAPTFEVEVGLPGYVAVTASGSSKRAAEQAAAETLLATVSVRAPGRRSRSRSQRP